MKELKDLEPADLMDEGRRWVIAPADFMEERGFRIEVVFENHPFKFWIGRISNRPALPQKLPYLPAEDDSEKAREAALLVAEEWCLKNHGIDKSAYWAIMASSMKAHEQCKYVKVLGDDADRLTLQSGFGEEIKLDEEAAIKLYQDLADALDLPCLKNCPTCGEIMEGDDCEVCNGEESSVDNSAAGGGGRRGHSSASFLLSSFFAFCRLGLFQYGDLHFGHTLGSSAHSCRETQTWPHLSHFQPGISTFAISRSSSCFSIAVYPLRDITTRKSRPLLDIIVPGAYNSNSNTVVVIPYKGIRLRGAVMNAIQYHLKKLGALRTR